MKVVLEPHAKEWADAFSRILEKLHTNLRRDVEIHHIGSTAIPGIFAKPIVDILIGIDDGHALGDYVEPITAMGYGYIPEYEVYMPFRRYFVMLDQNNNHTQHLHLVYRGHTFFEDHLFFRDHLLHNPATAKQYEALKKRLSQKEWKDGNEYASAKSDFIDAILEKKPKNPQIET
ncbi:MAG: GrpB family protein [Desulfobacteraceae bacterium]|nr:GrpB family protein [Desulfobacteraceae bacterium]